MKQKKNNFIRKAAATATGLLLALSMLFLIIPAYGLTEEAGSGETAAGENTNEGSSDGTQQASPAPPGADHDGSNADIFQDEGSGQQAVEFTVSFMSDGSEHARLTVVSGETVQPPADPGSAKGLEFQGWFEKEKNEEFDFNTGISEDLVLYARFTPIYHDVTYMDGEFVWHTDRVASGNLTVFPENNPASGDGKQFLGWQDGNGSFFDPRTIISADTTLYSAYDSRYLVTYLNTDGRILETAYVEPGAGVPAPTKAPDINNGEQVDYWADEAGGEFVFNSPAAGNLVLHPVVKNVTMVIFDAKGVEIEPIVAAGEITLNKPEFIPEKPGYKFLHWSESKDGPEYEFGQKVSGVLYLYAVWEAEPVGYFVNIWNEKANVVDDNDPAQLKDADKYELVYSKKIDASVSAFKSGEEVEISMADAGAIYLGGGEAVVNTLNYSDFVMSEEKTLLGDGSTVINVYYNRTVFTMCFSQIPYRTPIYDGSVSHTELIPGDLVKAGYKSMLYTSGGQVSYDDGGLYQIKVKMNQNVEDIFPTGAKLLNSSDEEQAHFINLNWQKSDKYTDYFSNGTRVITPNVINVHYNNGRSGRPANKSVILNLQWGYISDLYTHQRLYYTEMLPGELSEEQKNDADYLEQNDIKKFPLNSQSPSYYKFNLSSVVVFSRSSPASGASGWPGTSIDGFTQIIGGALINKYQLVQKAEKEDFPAPEAREHYNIYYFMPRNKYELSLNPGEGKFNNLGNYTQHSFSPVSNSNVVKANIYYEDDVSLLPSPELAGYEFMGWYIDEGLNEKADLSTMPSSKLMLYAKWAGNSCVVNYFDGTEKIGSKSYYYDDILANHDGLTGTDYSDYEAGQAIESKGVFEGWYFKAGENTVAALPFPLGMRLVKGEYNVYAKWLGDTYTVRFNISDDEYKDYNVSSGSDNTMALSGHYVPRVSKEGYAFIGWQTESGRYFTGSTPVGSNINLYPAFAPLIYTINYHANGGAGEIAPGKAEYGKGYTIKGIDGIAKTGHTFIGWNNDETAAINGTVNEGYNPGNYTSWQPVDNIDLYAVWEVNYYNVSYDGDGAQSGVPADATGIEYNTTYEIPAGVPVKNGYDFLGWESNADANSYFGLDTFIMPAADVKLTAKWEKYGQPTLNLKQIIYLDTKTGATVAGSDKAMGYEEFSALSDSEFLRFIDAELTPASSSLTVLRLESDFQKPEGGFAPGPLSSARVYEFKVEGEDSFNSVVSKNVEVRVVDSTRPEISVANTEIAYKRGSALNPQELINKLQVSMRDDWAKPEQLADALTHNVVEGFASATGYYEYQLETKDTVGNVGIAAFNIRVWDEIVSSEDIRIDTRSAALLNANDYIYRTKAGGTYYNGVNTAGEASRISSVNYSDVQPRPGVYIVVFRTEMGTEFSSRVTVVPTVYKATVNYNNGSDSAVYMVAEGGMIPVETANPARDGYDFAGWQLDDGGSWNFDENRMPSRDVVIDALWSIAAAPEATPTPVVTRRPTASPSPTPSVSPTPSPSATPAPGITPQPTEMPPQPEPTMAVQEISNDNGGTEGPGEATGAGEEVKSETPISRFIEQMTNGETPLSNMLQKNSHWALLNLIFTLLSTVMSILMFFVYRKKKAEQREREAADTGSRDDGSNKRKGTAFRIIGAVLGLVSIAVLLITQDFTSAMAFIDDVTIVNFILLVLQPICMALLAIWIKGGRKNSGDDGGNNGKTEYVPGSKAAAPGSEA